MQAGQAAHGPGVVPAWLQVVMSSRRVFQVGRGAVGGEQRGDTATIGAAWEVPPSMQTRLVRQVLRMKPGAAMSPPVWDWYARSKEGTKALAPPGAGGGAMVPRASTTRIGFVPSSASFQVRLAQARPLLPAESWGIHGHVGEAGGETFTLAASEPPSSQNIAESFPALLVISTPRREARVAT